MDNQVDEIKKKLDIVEVINHYLPLKKRGRHHVACCPFHQEKTPSFVVSPELQIFKCFGCGKSGDIFTFVQEYERVDFKDALQDLAKMAGVTLVKSDVLTHVESQKKLLIDINEKVAVFYHYILTTHPLGKKALDYVLGRGIKLATIKEFKIGFSPENSDLIGNYLFKKNIKLSDLVATGTFGQSQYGNHRLYDRFNSRLVFPLNDYRGQIVGFSGRVLPGAKAEQAKYINSPETEIYHKSRMLFGLHLTKEAIKKANSVLIVEGEFDLISPYQSGVQNIVALKGTAFTEEQLQLLKRYTDTLILALDSDFAGNNAAKKSIELADSMGFEIEVLDLENKYKDPDEAIKSDFAFFQNQLKHTLPVWDFIISAAAAQNDPGTIKGKKAILSSVLPSVSKIQNSVIRSDYLKKLAGVIGSDLDAVIAESQKIDTKAPSAPVIFPTGSINPLTVDKLEKLEEYLLILLFGSQRPLVIAKNMKVTFRRFSTPRFSELISLLLSSSEFQPQSFQDNLPAELQPIFQNIYLPATSTHLEPHHRHLEINKVKNQLQVVRLKNQIKDLGQQIAVLDNSDPDSKIKPLELKYQRLLGKLAKLQKP